MKRFTIISTIVLLTISTSCKKYLDIKPADFLAPQTYYANETQLTSALMAAYSELGNTNENTYSRFLSLEAPGSNDEEFYRQNIIWAGNYNTDAGYAKYIGCWTTLYSGINRCNALLENIASSGASQKVKDEIRGEALFLRAYYYFVLVGYWGDVPLKLSSTKSPEDINIARTPQADIYKQIVADMTTAEGLVNTAATWGNPGRISQTAAEGILARVCLHAAGRLNDPAYYPLARTWALKCMTSGVHSLNPDYRQIFINESADKYDLKEAMWEVEFVGSNASTTQEYERFGSTVGIQNNTVAAPVGYMQGSYVATATQFNLFNSADLRRDWAMAPYYYTSNDATKAIIPNPTSYVWGRTVAKWRRDYQVVIPKSQNFGPTNWPLLRYADVLLMFAEADNEVNHGPTVDAYNAINLVRRRAYGTGNKVNTITLTNQGSGYTTAPLVTIAASAATNGANNAATAYATVSGGKVTSIVLTSPGAFYTTAPVITISGTTGTGAVATAAVTAITTTSADLTPGLDYLDFFNAIKDERARELCFEGFRKLDLVRWGIFLPTMKAMLAATSTAPTASNNTPGYPGLSILIIPYTNVTSRDVVFPIPTQEITLNKLAKQNKDW